MREAEARRLAEQEAERQRVIEVLGPELAGFEVNTPADASYAIKLARLRKRELQARKRELASELADVREEWRGRQAGRISTVGLGRGTGARMVRAGIQAKRRSERQAHSDRVNAFSDARQDLDRMILAIDRLVMELERQAMETSGHD